MLIWRTCGLPAVMLMSLLCKLPYPHSNDFCPVFLRMLNKESSSLLNTSFRKTCISKLLSTSTRQAIFNCSCSHLHFILLGRDNYEVHVVSHSHTDFQLLSHIVCLVFQYKIATVPSVFIASHQVHKLYNLVNMFIEEESMV